MALKQLESNLELQLQLLSKRDILSIMVAELVNKYRPADAKAIKWRYLGVDWK